MIYYPQIGLNGMMVQLPFSQTFSHLTSVSELDSGPRQSYAWRQNPLKAWDLTYPALAPIEYETLLNFFLRNQGRYGEFCFLDPGGNMVPASENFADVSWEEYSVTVGGSVAGPFPGSVGTTITGTTNGMPLPPSCRAGVRSRCCSAALSMSSRPLPARLYSASSTPDLPCWHRRVAACRRTNGPGSVSPQRSRRCCPSAF